MGAWLGGGDMGDWISCIFFGVIGFFMKRGGWPRPPVILALVLGGILERTFQISTSIHDGMGWLGRPIVIALMLIIVVSVVLAARSIAKQKKSGNAAAGEGSEKNPIVSLPMSLLLFATFVWAGITALEWQPSVRQFPLLICIPGALLTFVVVVKDLKHTLAARTASGTWSVALQKASKDGWLGEAVPFFSYLIAMLFLSLLIGQKIALPIFVGVYLVRWGHYSKRIALAYSLVVWAILVFFYDRVMDLLFHTSYLAQVLQPMFSRGFPDWLIF
jgi:hypothetical protein